MNPDAHTDHESEKGGTEKGDAVVSEVDVAINEPLTIASARRIVLNPLTWLPSLA